MNNALVSVLVITYNSGEFVVETLESVKRQTYRPLELIISDDGSSDETSSICREWISKNKDEFVNSSFLTVKHNTGTPANVNRAVAAAKGVWNKIIAGDDLLLPTCIEDNVEFITHHPEASVVFSNIDYYTNEKGLGKYEVKGHKMEEVKQSKFSLSVAQQLEAMYEDSFCYTPTFFVKSELEREYPYDERYKLMEDYPHFITLLEKDIKFHYMDKPTVLYRVHNSSSYTVDSFINENHVEMLKLHFYNSLYEKLKTEYPSIFQKKQKLFLLYDFERFVLGNRMNMFTRIINSFVIRLLKL